MPWPLTNTESEPWAAPPSATQLAASFAAEPGTTIGIKVDELRFLGPDTALEQGRTTITPAGADRAPEITRFTVVYVKKNGQWLQSVVRDEYAHDVSPHDRLKELEWMVGEWINESQAAIVNTTCKWTRDGNFLVREFTMKTQGQPVLSGTQRIGWDPGSTSSRPGSSTPRAATAKATSPAMATGGFSRSRGCDRMANRSSATNIVTRLGKDRASWQSVDRTLGRRRDS